MIIKERRGEKVAICNQHEVVTAIRNRWAEMEASHIISERYSACETYVRICGEAAYTTMCSISNTMSKLPSRKLVDLSKWETYRSVSRTILVQHQKKKQEKHK